MPVKTFKNSALLTSLLFSLLFISWINHSSELTKKQRKVDQLQCPPFADEILTMKIDKEQLQDILKKNIKKRIVRFSLEKSGNNYVLEAWGVNKKGNGGLHGTVKLTPVPTGPRLTYQNSDKNSKHDLKRGQIKYVLGISRGTDTVIEDSQISESIVLVPCRDDNGKLQYYAIVESKMPKDCAEAKAPLVGGTWTNPSPPGFTCEIPDCDNLP